MQNQKCNNNSNNHPSQQCNSEIFRDSGLCKEHYTERLSTIKTIFTLQQSRKKTIEELAAETTEREIRGEVIKEIENTHTIILQDYIKSCIDTLIRTSPLPKIPIMADIYRTLKHKPRFSQFYDIICENVTSTYVIYNHTYHDILQCVWWRITQSPHKEELGSLLINDIIEGKEVCLNGQIGRLINVLNGFYDDIKLINNRLDLLAEYMSNIRGAKNAREQGMQYLRSAGIPQNKWEDWLHALEE
jgi:hypothetical protein